MVSTHRTGPGAPPTATPADHVEHKQLAISIASGDHGCRTLASDSRVRDHLRSAMSKELSRDDRLIVLLHYVEHMSIDEIACSLDMTREQVARRHVRILKDLRSRVAEFTRFPD